MGCAPAARILAIQAFGAAPKGAKSTAFAILKALDYAAAHGAQIVNMSFAGPRGAVIQRGIAALAAKGIVMVAPGRSVRRRRSGRICRSLGRIELDSPGGRGFGKPAGQAGETPDTGMARALNPPAVPAPSAKLPTDEIKPAAQ
jgi:hypothetical protein